MVEDLHGYNIDQIALRSNRPDLILERMGLGSQELRAIGYRDNEVPVIRNDLNFTYTVGAHCLFCGIQISFIRNSELESLASYLGFQFV